jgi:hypothetical protein
MIIVGYWHHWYTTKYLNMRKILLLFLSVLPQFIHAQGLIGTPGSLIVVYNIPDNYFYLEIIGEDKRTTEQDGVFIIDNRIVQIHTLHKKSFLEDNADQGLTNYELITKYINWEVDFIESNFSFNINRDIEFMNSARGKEFAFWTFDMPVPEPDISTDTTITTSSRKQMFVITRIGDYIVGINSPLFELDQFESIKDYLVASFDGLVESDEEFDLEELNRKVNSYKANYEEFKSILDECGMIINIPDGFFETAIVENSTMNYEYALTYPGNEYEVRYAIRPIRYKEYANAEVRDEMEGLRPFRNSQYEEIFKTALLNITGGVDHKIQVFNLDSVKEEFNADWGATAFVELDSDFGKGFKYCMIVTIHKKDVADAYYFYLANSKENFMDYAKPFFHSLKFE